MAGNAFLFPGQGSQSVGMGRDLFKGDSFFGELIACAKEITREDLERICIRGPERLLMQARILQPLMVSICLGYWKRLTDAGVQADYVLGHSLGEIPALAAAGVVSPFDAVRIAAKRGELMDEAAAGLEGGMMAAMFVRIDSLAALLEEFGRWDRIAIASDNAPEQVVLTGDNESLDLFAGIIASQLNGKTKRLQVSGPWHSPFMLRARQSFGAWVGHVPFSPPRVPLVMNASARTESDPELIRELLVGQLSSPVLWRQSMSFLKGAGVDSIFEIGPARVLSGLARVNGFGAETAIHNVNDLRGVELSLSSVRSH